MNEAQYSENAIENRVYKIKEWAHDKQKGRHDKTIRCVRLLTYLWAEDRGV